MKHNVISTIQHATTHTTTHTTTQTKECLHYSYAKISKGGYIYIDDYWAFPACQRAVDEFREENGIHDALYSVREHAR